MLQKICDFPLFIEFIVFQQTLINSKQNKNLWTWHSNYLLILQPQMMCLLQKNEEMAVLKEALKKITIKRDLLVQLHKDK